jgi:NodT family efflux transporter outer membrane factor (OMF) lipoprotein
MKSGRLFLLAALPFAACSLAPDYAPPEMPSAPLAYKEAGDWIEAKPADDAARGPWWQAFGDKRLDELEDEVTTANQNLKAALARYDEARAALGVARADYFPTVTGNAGASRQKLSGTTANVSGHRGFNDFLLGANASYEIDLWGRVRNEVAAAEGKTEASKADLADIALSLHAELAADYFALRGFDAMQDILDHTIEVDRKALDLVRERLKGGIATAGDVAQAETQFENAETQDSDMRLQRAQLEHAIAALTGKVPANFSLAPMPIGNSKPPPIDPGLSSQLLERRPDIAAAERLAFAANAEIGVARAAWFPAFSLTGGGGYESAAASNWLNAPSLFWSLGPSAVVTLFDAGRIESLSDEARGAYEESVANYRQTVLSAYQEVEDNLAALHHLDEEAKSAEAAANAARRALTQENNLYFGGAATYLDVAVTQNQALQADLALASIRARRMAAAAQLVKAIGGGWTAAEVTDTQ